MTFLALLAVMKAAIGGSAGTNLMQMVVLNISHELLSQMKVPDGVYCTNVNCIDPSHITDTNSFFNEITQCLIQASDTAFSKHNSSKARLRSRIVQYV